MDSSLTKPRSPTKSTSQNVFYSLGACLMVLVVLYFGRPVLLPIALSVLLAFILTPLVVVLEKWRLGRVLSVLLASFLAFAMIGLSAWALVSQLHGLAADLPNHQREIQHKISSLNVGENTTFGRLSHMFDDLLEDQRHKPDASRGDATGQELTTSIVQPPIVVQAEESSQFTQALDILHPVVEPLVTAAMVVVLVMFLLICREDVRFRIISLMGDSALTGTTRLMSDTAQRVSRYLLNLLLLNAGFGFVFGIGLYVLGVPYAALWGFLTLCLRFIPYLGSSASFVFPLMISFATSDGWSQTIYVAVFFVVIELLSSNVLEPVLFGKSTGLTPIALLIAALFWAWLWGPIGLLLSTPLTVCLVVLGQHLPNLRSLKVLLAEQPVLDARLQYFQRLLAGDRLEATKVFDAYVKELGQDRAFDEVVIPALKVARRERETGVITAGEQKFIWDAARSSIHSSSDSAVPQMLPLIAIGYPVHDPTEEIVLAMLAASLASVGAMKLLTTKHLPNRAIAEVVEQQPKFIVLAQLPPGGFPQTTYMCKQLKEKCPDSKIIVMSCGKPKKYDELLMKLRTFGASYLTTSIEQTKRQIMGGLDESTKNKEFATPSINKLRIDSDMSTKSVFEVSHRA